MSRIGERVEKEEEYHKEAKRKKSLNVTEVRVLKEINEYEERCIKELELGGGIEHLRLKTEGKIFALATLKQDLGLRGEKRNGKSLL